MVGVVVIVVVVVLAAAVIAVIIEFYFYLLYHIRYEYCNHNSSRTRRIQFILSGAIVINIDISLFRQEST